MACPSEVTNTIRAGRPIPDRKRGCSEVAKKALASTLTCHNLPSYRVVDMLCLMVKADNDIPEASYLVHPPMLSIRRTTPRR